MYPPKQKNGLKNNMNSREEKIIKRSQRVTLAVDFNCS